MSVKMRILIVDAEVDFAESLGFLLAHENHSVDWAFDGIEAVEKLLIEDFDFVITDYMMPHMNGDQLVEMFSKQPGKGPRFIFLSANTNLINIDDFKANLVAVFPKTIDVRQLSQKLHAEYEKLGTNKIAA